jgi:predicted transcriptional regulator
MSRIIFELEEIEDIKKRLESIIKRGQKIDSSDQKILVKRNQTVLPKFLDAYEAKVFEYIRNNPGSSKQDVVDALRGTRSRNPIFTIIEKLVEYGLVIKRTDNTNALRHQLFENKESLVVQVENDIKKFRRSYLNLLKRANLDSSSYQKKKHEPGELSPIVYSVSIDIKLTRILEKLIMGYSLKAIFEWSEEIKDPETLNRLNLMVFHMLSEIFSEHVKYSNPWNIQDEREKIVLIRDGFQNNNREIIYGDLIHDFDKYNWNSEFDSVMSDLFKALNMGRNWKEYRESLTKSQYFRNKKYS